MALPSPQLKFLFIDFAELNAPPMINYGVVYPQAILMFVITMLYSVQQPLIVIFGAIYFGAAYVVYKYKLLFGTHTQLPPPNPNLLPPSVLQALRIPRPSMAHHIRSPHMGCCYLLIIHDRHLHFEEVVGTFLTPRTLIDGHCGVVVLY